MENIIVDETIDTLVEVDEEIVKDWLVEVEDIAEVKDGLDMEELVRGAR